MCRRIKVQPPGDRSEDLATCACSALLDMDLACSRFDGPLASADAGSPWRYRAVA